MAGAGYKLFNTGDVLTAAQVNTYLQEQVVMVFNDASARTTALSGVLAEGMVSYLKSTDAVEIYNGSAWVGIAADQTPLTTKGDLFTYSTTDTRLAVGNNGETLVADSSATTGLRYTAGLGLTQPIINGCFDIWQRGTSISAPNAKTYTADRWTAGRSGNAWTVSRQNTNDTTNLPFIQYCARVQRDSGNTNTTIGYIVQDIETANAIPYAGKTVTFSFYARAGANFSAASNAMTTALYSGTGTDQSQWGTYTGIATVLGGTVTLTTTWQRFSFSATVASTTTELSFNFGYTPTGTAGANDFFEVTGVQIDVGSTALPIRRAGGTIAGELAACLYYFNRIADFSAGGSNGQQMIVTAQNFATTGGYGVLQYPKMRISPTATFSGNADFYATGAGGNNIATTAMAANFIKPNSAEIRYTTASGLVAGNAALLYTTTTAGKLDLSAEL